MLTPFLFLLCIGSLAVCNGACSIENYVSGSCLDPRGKLVSIDSGFRSSMNTICAAATGCNVKLFITDSYRKPDSVVLGAIVDPAALSNHKIGHAIDMNVVYGKSGTLCNSPCLGGNQQPTEVKCFINAVKNKGLRWGGDFKQTDPVHIDDGYNLNTANYKVLYAKIQKECICGNGDSCPNNYLCCHPVNPDACCPSHAPQCCSLAMDGGCCPFGYTCTKTSCIKQARDGVAAANVPKQIASTRKTRG
jgi:hypothetical protein